MSTGILVLLTLSIIAIIFFVVRLILNFKKGGFLYKSALKTIKSFSFSMILLLLFYGFSFGYSFGSLTANETYKQELISQNLDNNAHSMLVKDFYLNRGIYYPDVDDDEAENEYLTEDYWNLIFGTASNPESGVVDYIPYDPSYTWSDLSHLILPYGFVPPSLMESDDILLDDPTYTTTYEPIYGESYGLTPFAYYEYSSSNYLQHAIWNKIYSDLRDEYEFYYRTTTISDFTARTIESTELSDYRHYDMISLNDYDPLTNTYYSSFNDMYKENTFNDKVEVSERVQNKTNYNENTYIVGQYELSNIADGYSYDDLLSINNHYYDLDGNLTDESGDRESFNSLKIEIAISEQFYEMNPNIVLGNSYDFILDNDKIIEFIPIATFTDAYSSSNDTFFGSILINYLDFNLLKYDFKSTENSISTDNVLILQSEEYIDNNSVKMHTSKQYVDNFYESSKLPSYLTNLNNTVSNALFGVDANDLTIEQNDVMNNFYMGIDLNSIYNGNIEYYDNNLTGYSTFYIVNIFNVIILLMLFLVVIFIMYSVIGKKIKEQFKQFGILKSMGYKTSNISISFILFPILILLIANVLALALLAPFYWFQIDNLQSQFFININSFAFPTLIIWLIISFGILLFFSYVKIWRSLRKPELYLLSGSKRFKPGLLFRGASKISTKFKSFETSYAFKNIFKSIPKSSIVFTSTLFSLIIVGLALMISSFVKINVEQNFAAINFNNYYLNQGENAFPYGAANGDYRSLQTDYRSYQEYNARSIEEAVPLAYTLGDYTFAHDALNEFDVLNNFATNFENTTSIMLEYFIKNPTAKRNDNDSDTTPNRFDLFDYAYISSDSIKEYFDLEYLLFIQNEIENPTSTMNDFMNKPFMYRGNEYPFLTFGNVNNYYINLTTKKFKKFITSSGLDYINEHYPDLDFTSITVDDFFIFMNDLSDDGIKLYDDFFPSIYFGRTLYDKDTTSIFSYANVHINSSPNSDIKNTKTQYSSIFEDLEQINVFFNFETKKGETATELLKKEIPNKNKNYIPVMIDEGTSKTYNVSTGDYLYAYLYENSPFYELQGPEPIPLKIIGVYQNYDFGIITSQEFLVNRFMGHSRIFNAIATFDDDLFYDQVSAGFDYNTYEWAINKNRDIYLIQEQNPGLGIPIPSETNFRRVYEPNQIHYSIPLLKELSSVVYKEVTIAIMLSIIFILIIPLFVVLISIKEVIDDNVVEVSMLKSLGYNTWQTSRLILSSSLVIVAFSFVLLLPIMFAFGFFFNLLFIKLLALDLVFKLLWWNWLVLLFMLFIILGVLYSVSYYFYHRLKSKDVILNISK